MSASRSLLPQHATSFATAIFCLTIIISCTLILGSRQAEASPKKKTPTVLDENNWTQLLEGEWMFALHAPWCPACQRLKPEWDKFAEWSNDLNINIAQADVTANPALSGRFMVRGLPTIYHVKSGVFRIYNGPREHSALINYIEEQGWKQTDPISHWIAPDSLQMSFLAASFRFSMYLRDVHNHLVEKVGLPYYISYLLFALGTVTLGTILGLVIVFVIDLYCPSKLGGAAQEVKPKGSGKKRDPKATDSDLEDTTGETDEKNKASSSERVRRRATKTKE